jgi:transcriptional regulator with XRE-family HTH domain
MTIRREAVHDGDRQLRRVAIRFGEDFRELRLRFGVTQAAIARAIGVDRSVIARIERGDPTVANRIRARACAVLGADFRLALYPERAPLIYDAAHSRIVERLLALRHRRWRATVEAPVPGPGRRSSDVRLASGRDLVLFEIESRARRAEQLLRELHAKREAVEMAVGGRLRVHAVLVLPPTRHHQAFVRELPATIRAAFPVGAADLRRALESPDAPWPGDGILWVPGS